jgi:hypothetical protein
MLQGINTFLRLLLGKGDIFNSNFFHQHRKNRWFAATWNLDGQRPCFKINGMRRPVGAVSWL